VRATDADAPSSLNGQVKFRIITGAQDKFALNPTSGVMTVAPDATFDYDVKKLYEMTVSVFISTGVNITHSLITYQKYRSAATHCHERISLETSCKFILTNKCAYRETNVLFKW